MRLSTINPLGTKKQKAWKALAVLFWLLLWQGLAAWVNSPILLVSPIATLRCLAGQIVLPDFWRTVGNTTLRILLGFAAGSVLGIALAVLAYRVGVLRFLLSPLISVMKSVPNPAL